MHFALPASWIHLFATHFEPVVTGQPACRVCRFRSIPSGRMLYQKIASFFRGLRLILRRATDMRPAIT